MKRVCWGGSKGAGTDPLGQHVLSSDRASAGRWALTPLSSARNETSVKGAPTQPEVHATDEHSNVQVRGGDRRITSRQARESRVTVRLSDEESAQLTRVAQRYRLAESGAIRAAIDYLDGAPAPKPVNRDVLRLIGEVNAVGVNVNQLARQGWAGVEPDIDALRRVTATLLAIAKEMSS
ncbi:hypothetical protein [Corynebacterium mayonis]|uniref:hypothetical protein n=1 Tax=Corynebacterium mayonis TaxID=3062461 RepID=UPI0031404D5F